MNRPKQSDPLSLADVFDRLLERAAIEEHPSFLSLTEAASLDPAYDFIGASLRGVDFRDQDLRGFNFTNADLTGSDFRRAKIDRVSFEGANLTGVIGLSKTFDVVSNSVRPPTEFDLAEVHRAILFGKAPPVSWRPFIHDLNFAFDELSDLRPLAGLTNVRYLSLLSTQVSDLSPLANLTDLDDLNLGQLR